MNGCMKLKNLWRTFLGKFWSQEKFKSSERTTTAGTTDGNLNVVIIDVRGVLIVYLSTYLCVTNAGSDLATGAEGNRL